MDDLGRKVLARYQRSLSALLEQVDAVTTSYVPLETFRQMDAEISSAVAAFPELLPAFDGAALKSHNYYRPAALSAYLARALAAIDSELAANPRGEVIGPTLTFSFMTSPELRRIVERDYPELLTAFASSCKKSCLILAGGLIEAVLLDFVLQDVLAARNSSAAPKDPDPTKWSLENLINVSVDLKPTLTPVQTASHTVRRYRNLVHPAVELKSSMKVEIEEARLAIAILQIVHRELSGP